MSSCKYMTVRDVLASDILTEEEKKQLRYWIANAVADPSIRSGYWMPGSGLESALIRIERRLLIDRERFINWLAGYRELKGFYTEFKMDEVP